MTRLRLAFAITALLLAAASQGADKPCSPAEAAKAEKSVDLVVNWPQLHKAFQDYGHCDTGPVAEVYTDAILRLAVEWKNVEAFAAAAQKDAKYKEFVYAHLKPASKDDRTSIYQRARQSCPKGFDALCAEICEVVNPPATPPPAAAAAPAATK